MNLVLSHPSIQRLGWTLIQFLWQGTVVAIGFAILRAVLGHVLSPQGRYVLACCAMAAMAVLPALTYFAASEPGAIAVSPWPLYSPDAWQRVLPWLALGWLIGAAGFTIRFAIGWVSSIRLRKIGVVPLPIEWNECLMDLRARLRVLRPVEFLESSIAEVPMMIGWLKPVILIPAGVLAGMPTEYVRALLAHELAHIRRFDYLVNILQSVTEAALFYHPAVWWISDQIRADRESCCDDMAVAASGDVLVYVRALSELETRRAEFRGVAMAASGGQLVRRIRRLVHPAAAEHSIPGPVAAAFMSVLWITGMGAVAAHGSPAKQTTGASVSQLPQPNLAVQVAVNGGLRIPDVLLAPFGPQAPRATTPAAAPARSSLSGIVVDDHSGSPAVSVAVSVYREGSTVEAAEFETDSSGRFGGVDLPPGYYRLEFAKANFIAAKRQVALSSAQNLTVRMVRLGAVTGTITDAQGNPVSGVAVAAMPKPPNGEPLRAETGYLPYAASSDARGKYRIYGIPPGTYAIVMTYGDARDVADVPIQENAPARMGSGLQYYPSNTRPDFLTIVSGSEQRGIDFKMPDQSLFNITGTVESGDTSAPFGITLLRADQSSVAIETRSAASGAEFRFTGIPPGSYRLVASRRNIPANAILLPNGQLTQRPPGTPAAPAAPPAEPVFAEARVEIGGGDPQKVILRPAPGRSVKFSLKTVPGCPDNVRMALVPRDEWGPDGRKQGNLTSQQVLTVAGLAPGAYTVRLLAISEPTCFGPVGLNLDMSGGDLENPVVIAIGRAGAIKGSLQTSGQDPGDFAVALTPDDGSSAEVITADARGQFAFQNVRPGSYRLGAYRSNRAMPGLTQTIEVQVGPESSLDVTLPVAADAK